MVILKQFWMHNVKISQLSQAKRISCTAFPWRLITVFLNHKWILAAKHNSYSSTAPLPALARMPSASCYCTLAILANFSFICMPYRVFQSKALPWQAPKVSSIGTQHTSSQMIFLFLSKWLSKELLGAYI